jgi:hypothetical protein
MRCHLIRPGSSVLVAVCALAVAASTATAYVCHPDPPGTLSLRVHAPVTGYQLLGSSVRVTYGTTTACRRANWNLATRSVMRAPSSACARTLASSAAVPTPRGVRLPAGYVATAAARSDGQLVILAHPRGNGDAPDLLDVRTARTAARLHVWPLPAHMATLDVAAGIAVMSGGPLREVYALDLRTGRTALIGLDRAVDRPRLSAAGVVYVDDLYKRDQQSARQTLKFLPIAAVHAALERAGTPVVMAGRISALAMDGARVAVGVRDPNGACDSVQFWNVPWAYTSRLTDPHSKTCPAGHGKGGITSLALSGVRAEWITTYGHRATLLTATIVACRQRILAASRAGALTGLAGHGGLLAYSAASGTSLVAGTSSRLMAPGARATAIDGHRLAILRSDGHIELRAPATSTAHYPTRTPVLVLQPTSAREIALQGNELAVLSSTGRLEVFDTRSGARQHVWNLPRGASGLDMQYGIATVAVGHRVYAVRLSTGRTAVIVQAPAGVRAAIEAPGLSYAYSLGNHGHLQFVPLTAIWHRLGITE